MCSAFCGSGNRRTRDLDSAKNQAKQIVNDAYKSAEGKKREALLEAKEEILKAKNDHEREVRERRAELQRQEHRLQQKEENLDRKTENMEKREEQLAAKLLRLDETQAQAEKLKQEQVEALERISGFTSEEAKRYLLDQLEADVTHESAMKMQGDRGPLQGRGRHQGPGDRLAGHPALRRRPCGRGHRVCGAPAQ